MSEELFKRGELLNFLNNKLEKIKADISKICDEKIISVDNSDWLKYYESMYKVEKIELYLENIEQKINKTIIKRRNPFHHSQFEPEYFDVEGYKISFNIPYSGDADLLYYTPSTRFLSSFIIDKVSPPTDSELGLLVYSLSYSQQDINMKEDPKEFINNEFNNNFKNYVITINRVNEEVAIYNKKLEQYIGNLLIEKEKKVQQFIDLADKLDIELNIKKDAPNIIPIKLKKVVKPIEEPKSKKVNQKEYEISDYDYNNIRNIINNSCVSMERTAQTFIKLDEEELRDVILSNLNTHYIGAATGETFSKIGKTDIYIYFENKAAYIGECKIWHGIKKFEEAIEQLFSYTTWRDIKTSIVIFNKKNKDFRKVLDEIESYINENSLCLSHIRKLDDEWLCELKKSSDTSEVFYIQILVYDLYVTS